MSGLKELVENIERAIPGLKEYKEKEELREEDMKVRELVRNTLQKASETLRDLEQYLIMTVPNFDPTFFEEQVIQRLEVVLRRVESAEAGYGGWLSHINIEQPQLIAILENDQKLLEEVAKFGQEVLKLQDSVKAGQGGVDVVGLSKLIGSIEAYLSKRDEILRSGGGAE